ncbi:hypothetical protein GW7_12542 [Heterocephalus glaber]|uniref:Uncharacterized protein n=1 Tax=Heterocephalus glaber TaxID=10181 RepID=G5AR60_HETGA|nr:hypothetical protein GW7_12542 [Heterocephalus glaber]
MESGEALSTGTGVGPAALPPAEAYTVSPSLLTTLMVVVEVEFRRGSGPEAIQSPLLLLEEPKSLHLLPLRTLESQEQCFTFDRVLSPDGAQKAEQELLEGIQSTLASVGRGYSVALILRGRETEATRLVPQLLQVLFEEALLCCSDCTLTTLSLVQISPSGRTRDLLSPGLEDLSVLEVAPLGLVVEGASEVEVSDSRAASELYLQATGGEGRTCYLLTLTISCPGPALPEGPGTQGMWQGALRILQLLGALDCPLLQVLAGEVVGEEMEGSLLWIISQLLEGNNYGGLLLHLDPQGSSLSLLRAALLGASQRRLQVKQVRPILWNAVDEAQARRAALKTLRLGLLGNTLTDGGLSQLGRALWELQVVKAWSQCPRNPVPKGARAEVEKLPEPQAQRQRLQEKHQIWIQEELKHLGQEEVAGEQVKGLVAEEEVRRVSMGLGPITNHN